MKECLGATEDKQPDLPLEVAADLRELRKRVREQEQKIEILSRATAWFAARNPNGQIIDELASALAEVGLKEKSGRAGSMSAQAETLTAQALGLADALGQLQAQIDSLRTVLASASGRTRSLAPSPTSAPLTSGTPTSEPRLAGARTWTKPSFPPHQTVYWYYAAWQREGVTEQIHEALRIKRRRQAGRAPRPHAAIADAQSVKTSANVPESEQGIDAGKKIKGRKRHIVTDFLGLVLAVVITAASVSDTAGGRALVDRISVDHPSEAELLVDNGYQRSVIDRSEAVGIDITVTQKPGGVKGFQPTAGGRSSAPSAGSCSTAAWSATTRPCSNEP